MWPSRVGIGAYALPMLEEMKMNNTLPVAAFRNQIVKAVTDHSVVVITAETGAGKSTQVPQFLIDEGYNLVVTQPRRLAARTVAERVAEEQGCQLGGVVGYRTAVDRQDSAATRCLFVCGCGVVVQLTKSIWKSYQAGEGIQIACSVCGARASLTKAGKTHSLEAVTSAKKGDEDTLTPAERLAKAWGTRR